MVSFPAPQHCLNGDLRLRY